MRQKQSSALLEQNQNSEVSTLFAISSTSLLKPLFCLIGIAAESHEVTLTIFVFLASSLSSVMDIVTWHLSTIFISPTLYSL